MSIPTDILAGYIMMRFNPDRLTVIVREYVDYYLVRCGFTHAYGVDVECDVNIANDVPHYRVVEIILKCISSAVTERG